MNKSDNNNNNNSAIEDGLFNKPKKENFPSIMGLLSSSSPSPSPLGLLIHHQQYQQQQQQSHGELLLLLSSSSSSPLKNPNLKSMVKSNGLITQRLQGGDEERNIGVTAYGGVRGSGVGGSVNAGGEAKQHYNNSEPYLFVRKMPLNHMPNCSSSSSTVLTATRSGGSGGRGQIKPKRKFMDEPSVKYLIGDNPKNSGNRAQATRFLKQVPLSQGEKASICIETDPVNDDSLTGAGLGAGIGGANEVNNENNDPRMMIRSFICMEGGDANGANGSAEHDFGPGNGNSTARGYIDGGLSVSTTSVKNYQTSLLKRHAGVTTNPGHDYSHGHHHEGHHSEHQGLHREGQGYHSEHKGHHIEHKAHQIEHQLKHSMSYLDLKLGNQSTSGASKFTPNIDSWIQLSKDGSKVNVKDLNEGEQSTKREHQVEGSGKKDDQLEGSSKNKGQPEGSTKSQGQSESSTKKKDLPESGTKSQGQPESSTKRKYQPQGSTKSQGQPASGTMRRDQLENSSNGEGQYEAQFGASSRRVGQLEEESLNRKGQLVENPTRKGQFEESLKKEVRLNYTKRPFEGTRALATKTQRGGLTLPMEKNEYAGLRLTMNTKEYEALKAMVLSTKRTVMSKSHSKLGENGSGNTKHEGFELIQELGRTYTHELGKIDPRELGRIDPFELRRTYTHELGKIDPRELAKADTRELGRGDPCELGRAAPRELAKADPHELGRADLRELAKADVRELRRGDPCELRRVDPFSLDKADPNELGRGDLYELGNVDTREFKKKANTREMMRVNGYETERRYKAESSPRSVYELINRKAHELRERAYKVEKSFEKARELKSGKGMHEMIVRDNSGSEYGLESKQHVRNKMMILNQDNPQHDILYYHRNKDAMMHISSLTSRYSNTSKSPSPSAMLSISNRLARYSSREYSQLNLQSCSPSSYSALNGGGGGQSGTFNGDKGTSFKGIYSSKWAISQIAGCNKDSGSKIESISSALLRQQQQDALTTMTTILENDRTPKNRLNLHHDVDYYKGFNTDMKPSQAKGEDNLSMIMVNKAEKSMMMMGKVEKSMILSKTEKNMMKNEQLGLLEIITPKKEKKVKTKKIGQIVVRKAEKVLVKGKSQNGARIERIAIRNEQSASKNVQSTSRNEQSTTRNEQSTTRNRQSTSRNGQSTSRTKQSASKYWQSASKNDQTIIGTSRNDQTTITTSRNDLTTPHSKSKGDQAILETGSNGLKNARFVAKSNRILIKTNYMSVKQDSYNTMQNSTSGISNTIPEQKKDLKDSKDSMMSNDPDNPIIFLKAEEEEEEDQAGGIGIGVKIEGEQQGEAELQGGDRSISPEGPAGPIGSVDPGSLIGPVGLVGSGGSIGPVSLVGPGGSIGSGGPVGDIPFEEKLRRIDDLYKELNKEKGLVGSSISRGNDDLDGLIKGTIDISKSSKKKKVIEVDYDEIQGSIDKLNERFEAIVKDCRMFKTEESSNDFLKVNRTKLTRLELDFIRSEYERKELSLPPSPVSSSSSFSSRSLSPLSRPQELSSPALQHEPITTVHTMALSITNPITTIYTESDPISNTHNTTDPTTNIHNTIDQNFNPNPITTTNPNIHTHTTNPNLKANPNSTTYTISNPNPSINPTPHTVHSHSHTHSHAHAHAHTHVHTHSHTHTHTHSHLHPNSHSHPHTTTFTPSITKPKPIQWERLDTILHELPFFYNFSKHIRISILQNSQYIEYSPGHIIYKEGDYIDMIYIILNGAINVKKFMKNPQGKQENMLVKCLYEGSMFGESSSIEPIANTTTTTAAAAANGNDSVGGKGGGRLDKGSSSSRVYEGNKIQERKKAQEVSKKQKIQDAIRIEEESKMQEGRGGGVKSQAGDTTGGVRVKSQAEDAIGGVGRGVKSQAEDTTGGIGGGTKPQGIHNLQTGAIPNKLSSSQGLSKSQIPDIHDKSGYSTPRRRSVTIEVGQSVSLLCIPKEIYTNILLGLLESELEDRVNVLHGFTCFEKQDSLELLPLANSLASRRYQMGEKIIRTGEMIPFFGIVAQGRCKICLEYIIHKNVQNTPRIKGQFSPLKNFTFGNDPNVKEGTRSDKDDKFKNMKVHLEISSASKPRAFEYDPVDIDHKNDLLVYRKHLTLNTLTRGQCFGVRTILNNLQMEDIAALTNDQIEYLKARVDIIADSSNVEIYTIDKTRVENLPEGLKRALKEGIKEYKDFDEFNIDDIKKHIEGMNAMKRKVVYDALMDTYALRMNQLYQRDYKKF